MKPGYRLAWIVLFAVAMGYLEASVVVYLRALYYPGGFDFPLKPMPHLIAVTEICRELTTLVMLSAVAVLAAKTWLQRFAWFLALFGIWDIVYYLFLKVLLGWPESLLTIDILFLIPSIWTGPVFAPLINSFTMIALASVIHTSSRNKIALTRITSAEWLLLISGSILVLIAYTKDFILYVSGYMHTHGSISGSWDEAVNLLVNEYLPPPFSWQLFGLGILMHLSAILLILNRKRKS